MATFGCSLFSLCCSWKSPFSLLSDSIKLCRQMVDICNYSNSWIPTLISSIYFTSPQFYSPSPSTYIVHTYLYILLTLASSLQGQRQRNIIINHIAFNELLQSYNNKHKCTLYAAAAASIAHSLSPKRQSMY